MKKITVILCSLVLLLSAVGTAIAVPWTWTDSRDPSDVLLDNNNKFYHYQHNINDNGFSPLSDYVTNYTLEVFLRDDKDKAYESAYVSAPLTSGLYDFKSNSNIFGDTLAGLIEINALGILDVTISRLWGDFYFDKSYLKATGNETHPTSVPEPGTVLALGVVLFGLVAVNRKRFSDRK